MQNLMNPERPFINLSATCLFLFLFLAPCLVKAQFAWDTTAPRTRNFIFTTPVGKNTVINGLAIGFSPVPWRKAQRLSINGVSISASPLDLFLSLYVLPRSLTLKDGDSTHSHETVWIFYKKETDTVKDSFNGLVLATITPGDHSNGINISVVTNSSHSMNGLSIAGISNFHYSFNGILIAGLRNKTTIGRGLQIGLLNQCKEGRKLVQIGLLNKIGKRTTPFINFQF
jgi:hypothetical protein